MRGIAAGTRASATQRNNFLGNGSQNGSLSTDLGSSKNVVASVTFSASPAQLQAANGTFPAVAVGDSVRVSGSNLNNGVFLVTGVDITNRAFLAVARPPKAEGPISVRVRTE